MWRGARLTSAGISARPGGPAVGGVSGGDLSCHTAANLSTGADSAECRRRNVVGERGRWREKLAVASEIPRPTARLKARGRQQKLPHPVVGRCVCSRGTETGFARNRPVARPLCTVHLPPSTVHRPPSPIAHRPSNPYSAFLSLAHSFEGGALGLHLPYHCPGTRPTQCVPCPVTEWLPETRSRLCLHYS